MSSLRRALLVGFLVWLIPLLISMCIFRVRQSNRPLFESRMAVALATVTAAFLNRHFRRVEHRFALVEAQGAIGIQELEGGEYAVATHKGPYDRLGETYARLCGEWLAIGAVYGLPVHASKIRDPDQPSYELRESAIIEPRS